MTKCKRCGKQNVDVHTCIPRVIMSDCCGGEVWGIGGRQKWNLTNREPVNIQPGKTYHYECGICGKDCAIA